MDEVKIFYLAKPKSCRKTFSTSIISIFQSVKTSLKTIHNHLNVAIFIIFEQIMFPIWVVCRSWKNKVSLILNHAKGTYILYKPPSMI